MKNLLLAIAAVSVLLPPAWAEEAPAPAPASGEYLRELQRNHHDQAKIIWFGDRERFALVYKMRYQQASTLLGTSKPPVPNQLEAFQDPGGKLTDLAYLNALFIIADEEHLRVLLAMLEIFDSPSPQVQIEAKIVEVTHSNDFQWGINIFQTKGLQRDSVTGQVSPLVATDAARTFHRGSRGLFDPDAFISAQTPGGSPYRGGELSFGITADDELGDLGRLDVVLRALEDTGRGQILSQPSILATVGKTSKINVGEQVPVPEVKEQPNGTFTSIKFKDVGINLEVTPIIIAEDNITLHIKPEVSFVIEFILVGTGGVSTPRISSRNVDTVVSVRDGEAIVIGGLIQTQESTDEVKFPILGDIPVVGNLFKTYRKRNDKTEVFFFLEPHIVTRQFRRPAIFVPDSGR